MKNQENSGLKIGEKFVGTSISKNKESEASLPII